MILLHLCLIDQVGRFRLLLRFWFAHDCLVGGLFFFTNHQTVVLPSESTHTVVDSAIRLEPF